MMGKGKRKTEIKKVDDRKRRDVTFCKRRKGLFGKALNTSMLCNAKIAMIIFSAAGNPYTFFTQASSIDDVIDQYLSHRSFETAGSAKKDEEYTQMFSSMAKEITEVEWEDTNKGKHLNQYSCEGKKVGFWWDLVDVDGCNSLEELQLLRSSLEDLYGNISQRLFSLSSQMSTFQTVLADETHVEVPALVDDVHAELPALVDAHAELPALVDGGHAKLPSLDGDILAELFLGVDDESGDVAASDFFTDLSSCPSSSADEDAGTVFANISDERYVDGIDIDDIFDHLDDLCGSAIASDFIIGKNDFVPCVDENASMVLTTNYDGSYISETVLDNMEDFFEHVLF
ncbi:hypothetical protein NE237_001175 [Protea cynaroides]|uniref:MADS-box domain-containing protein n=1 Tax=Protea cynaroides TaxID=273540 RepID=A0A9Q0KT08_9MAGN|nr:hypothetical protein NE237_001175 [Protea cynaroides]